MAFYMTSYVDIAVPQKSLFLHTFSYDLSACSVLKEWRH